MSASIHLSPNVRCLVWDLDGTIIDSLGLYVDILTVVLQSKNLPVPSTVDLQSNFHGTLENSVADATGLEGDELDEVIAAFLELQDPYYDRLDGHIFSDALRLMERAYNRGLKQIVITNRSHKQRKRASPKHIIAQPPLVKYLSHVVCGDDTDFQKPDPRMLNEVEQMMELNPSSLVVIGDQHVDAELGTNLGTASILVDRDKSAQLKSRLNRTRNVTIVHSLDMIELE